MSSKPVLVFLKNKLGDCLQKGTSVKEAGLTVSTATLQGETILFFHTDSSSARQTLKMTGQGFKICDYLVAYTREQSDIEVLCLLELKGNKLEEAVQQILSTHTRIKALLKDSIDRQAQSNIVWKVCICMHGQAPRGKHHSLDELKKKFPEKHIHIKHGAKHYKELGTFLREI